MCLQLAKPPTIYRAGALTARVLKGAEQAVKRLVGQRHAIRDPESCLEAFSVTQKKFDVCRHPFLFFCLDSYKKLSLSLKLKKKKFTEVGQGVHLLTFPWWSMKLFLSKDAIL